MVSRRVSHEGAQVGTRPRPSQEQAQAWRDVSVHPSCPQSTRQRYGTSTVGCPVKIKNTSGLDIKLVRRIIRFCTPKNLDTQPLSIWIKKSKHAYAGRYYGYRWTPRVIARVGKKLPTRLRLYQYGQHKGRRHWLADREEVLVYIMAHELRHAWQHRGSLQNSSFPVGRVRGGARGYSEVDTEAYAIHTLRRWRKMKA